MKTVFSFLAFFLFFQAFAQLTETGAKIVTQPKGDVILALPDSSTVYLGQIKDGFYKTSKVGLVKTEFFNESDSTILKGAILYGPDKKEIGQINTAVKTLETRPSDVLRWRKYVWVKVDGQISANDVYYNSIPEKGIEKLVNAKNRGGLYDKMLTYFNELGFVKEEYDDFTAFTYLDVNKTVAAEKEYRAIAVFRGETALYCIITNKLPFTLEKQKDYKENGAGNYYFLLKPNDSSFEAITNIAYDNIPL